MRTVKTECPKCGKVISHEFVAEDEEVDEDSLCLQCRAWEKNGDRREFFIRIERKQRKEEFEEWVKDREEHGYPVDVEEIE